MNELEGQITQYPPMDELDEQHFKYEPSIVSIYLGDRVLNLYFDMTCNAVSPDFHKSDEKVKVPGTTTAMFAHAKRVVEHVSRMFQTPITFEYGARLPQMKMWAILQDKGAGLYDWDILRVNQFGILEAKKVIRGF